MLLTNYKLLGHSGLAVSPLCFGAMTFGTDWGWGADKDDSRRMFELYTERGGNFIDTAINYTDGTSESYLGEFMEVRRDELVIATKYSLSSNPKDPNAGGNSRKNMMRSVEKSLKRLRTDHIDVYYLHVWEGNIPIEEVLRGFDDLVTQGKILYIGISDTPAWKVAQAQVIAEFRNLAPITSLQLKYSLMDRSLERDLLPMAREFRIGVTTWSVLGGGWLTGKYQNNESGLRPNISAQKENDRSLRIAQVVTECALEIGCTPSQLAIRWNMEQEGVTCPILGARTIAQLEDNLGALDVTIPIEVMQRLNDATAPELGFPHSMLQSEHVKKLIRGETTIRR
ncbi:aldo/keto reductase [bacterium]|nr:aldo/keto reductase [bacterium]